MSIIITKTFQKDARKIFGNIQNFDEFCDKFIRSHKISLLDPFKKFKFSFNGISVRGIYVMTSNENYIPIFIVKKSDKKYGMNLVISSENLSIIENKYEKSYEDIDNSNYIKI